MDVFRTDRIRNVVLLGHSGSGKTSLTEAMAYLSGMTSRLGKVTDGNTVSDFDKEEILCFNNTCSSRMGKKQDQHFRYPWYV